MHTSRRKFLKKMGTGILIPFVPLPTTSCQEDQPEEALKIHLFSKHLQFLDIKEAAQMAAELGFDGLDLTVRPKGHILPEKAVTDLPVAIQDIKKSGSSCEIITTAISDIENPYDVQIIKTAAKEGVRYYRSNWFKYHKDKTMQESIKIYQQKVKELGGINEQHNIIGCYQNHAGTKIGASCWEVEQLLATVNPLYFGTQYDIRHAMVEGGLSWQNGLRLLHKQIKTIVLKDYKWKKVGSKWKVENVPIGEGMVDFKTYFSCLKKYGLTPPTSLHLEYPLGGAEKGRYEITVDKKVVFDAMKKDLTTLYQLWKDAD